MQQEIGGRTFEFTLQRVNEPDMQIEYMYDDGGNETFDIVEVVEVFCSGGPMHMLEAGDKIVMEIIID